MRSATRTTAGFAIPDSRLAGDATQLVRDIATDLLYDHSRRVFLWGASIGGERPTRPSRR
jgi:hypothetical protein